MEEGAAGLFPIKDRTCKKCGTLYHLEMPPVLAYAMLVGGLAATLGPMSQASNENDFHTNSLSLSPHVDCSSYP